MWDDYWREVGVPEDEQGTGADSIVDPDGRGPRIWFQVVPESKTVKNRLHIDVHASGGRAVPIEIRRRRVDAEARRLTELGATVIGVMEQEGLDHYAVAMKDPEGNEFDIN
jgi:Glyoxalase-like domain